MVSASPWAAANQRGSKVVWYNSWFGAGAIITLTLPEWTPIGKLTTAVRYVMMGKILIVPVVFG